MAAPARDLTIVSADQDLVAAAQAAAAQAGDAVGTVSVIADFAALDCAEIDGHLLLDPRIFSAHSLHEWVMTCVREQRVLVWIMSFGNNVDADGLARFVGAQGALEMPLDLAAMSERLGSPFGVPTPVRPKLGIPDDEAILQHRDDILGGEEEDSFVANITQQDNGLFSAPYYNHRRDEERKRAHRFRFPCSEVSFSCDGELDDATLLAIVGVILCDTRDIDIVSQLGPSKFAALLPHTGPHGAKVFAERTISGLKKLGLKDVLDDDLDWEFESDTCPDGAG